MPKDSYKPAGNSKPNNATARPGLKPGIPEQRPKKPADDLFRPKWGKR